MLERSDHITEKLRVQIDSAIKTFSRLYPVKQIEKIGHEFKYNIDGYLDSTLRSALSCYGLEVYSEEDEESYPKGGSYWVIDPLDGSVNYARGIPHAYVSVALIINGVASYGFVYDLYNRFTWAANIKGWSFRSDDAPCLNKKGKRKGEEIILFTGFPSAYDRIYDSNMAAHFATVDKVRMIGTATGSIMSVLMGRGDIYIEYGIRCWDVLGALVIAHVNGYLSSYDLVDVQLQGPINIALGASVDRLEISCPR